MTTNIDAYQEYLIDKAAHDAANPFDVVTNLFAPMFRDMTAQERAGELESEYGIVKALFILLRTADERGLNDIERQMVLALQAAHLEA